MVLTAAAQKKPKPAPRLGAVTIDRFMRLEWKPETNYFKSSGPLRITLEDAETGEKTILLADDAEGSPTGDILVQGNLRLERPEGTLTGRTLTYRAETRSGSVLDAEGRAGNLLLRGQKIEMLPDQVLRVTNASFTTCRLARPEYRITAREVRVLPSRIVRAKDITVWVGGTRLLSLPSLERSFRRTVRNPIPLPGYSKENGVVMHFQNEVIKDQATAFHYDILLTLRRTPQGSIAYEHDLGHPDENAAPPRTHLVAIADPLRSPLEVSPALLKNSSDGEETRRRAAFYALLSASEFVYNRQRTDLRVSRLPEIGFSLRNILNRTPQEGTEADPRPHAPSVFSAGFFSPANWLVNAEVSLGYLQERLTSTKQARLSALFDAVSPLFRVANAFYFRYGVAVWQNVYGSGDAYTLLAPEAELNYLLGRSSLIGAAYRYQQSFGQTPFFFDRRDVRHELRLRYGFSGGRWAYDLGVNYDLERKRAYDTTFSLRRRFDCMEIGFSYQTRSQGFGLIFNLLPGSLDRAKPPAGE